MNGLKLIYTKLPNSVRSRIREELEARAIQYHRLSYWLNKEDALLTQMPSDLMQIVVANIPDSIFLFQLEGIQLSVKEFKLEALS